MFDREIRDPIHRTIGVTAEEVAFIDHPYVQRLRHVRQLGLSYLVYPGATHDRFSHSIGAMHVVGLMWSAVTDRGEVLTERFDAATLRRLGRLLRLAALLHDIGHPPFSHVSEMFLPDFAKLDFPRSWLREEGKPKRRARHEDMSVVLIRDLASGDEALLDETDAQDIASLVHAEVKPSDRWHRDFGVDDQGLHALLKSFVSGELDCDRMDYLLRDAYMAGTVYGNYDMDRLVNSQGIEEHRGRLVRFVDTSAIRSFEDFLLARYHMFLQVYLHKTSVGFDVCLGEAVRSGEFDLQLPTDAAAYAGLRDSTVLERWHEAAKFPENQWSRRLARREPLKLVIAAERTRPGDEELLGQVGRVLEEAGVRGYEVSSKHYLSRMPLSSSDGMLYARRKLLGRPVLEPMARYSDLLKKYNEQIRVTHLYVRREDWSGVSERLARLDVRGAG